MPRFRYALDPICLAAIACFAVNRWLLKPHAVAPAFTGGYVNDLLCLPIFVPISLWLQRRFRLRTHDGPPRAWEVAQHWLVFSIVFEAIVPRLPGFASTADAWDVVAYAVGGAAAGVGWRLTAPSAATRASGSGGRGSRPPACRPTSRRECR